MASAYKNIAGTVSYTVDTVLYTCPAATVGLVKNINLYNSHTGTIVVYLKFWPAEFINPITLFKLSLSTLTSSSAPAALSTGSLVGPYVCEAGDKLLINCDVASKIQVFTNILELS